MTSRERVTSAASRLAFLLIVTLSVGGLGACAGNSSRGPTVSSTERATGAGDPKTQLSDQDLELAVGILGDTFPGRPGGGKDLDDGWRDGVNRAIDQIFDCPTTIAAVSDRLGRPFLTTTDLFKLMNDNERLVCDAEGDDRAVDRVNERLQRLPEEVAAILAPGLDYIEKRSAMIASQCESDRDTMFDANSEYYTARSRAYMRDTDFYWDLARAGKSTVNEKIVRQLSSGELSGSVAVFWDESEKAVHINVTIDGLPNAGHDAFEWANSSFTLDDKYGPGVVFVSQTIGRTTVEDIDLKPLPTLEIPFSNEWVRKAKTNVSTGTYRWQELAPAGYRRCSHEIHVWSANNVCDNEITANSRGIYVVADIKSGSFIDKWRGWLRFRGDMTVIDESATRCQIGRAQCTPGTQSGLVSEDAVCRSGARRRVDEICFREGIPPNEMCHIGKYNDQNRCVVHTITPCY